MTGYVYRGSPELAQVNAAIMAARTEDPPRYQRGFPAPHGTRAAHRRHLRHGEEPCQACKDAQAAHMRKVRAR